jgi:molybdenum cofactor cytidylyltransferase
MPDTGVVVLAAGGSSRMGEPKQLLDLAGRPLVRRAAETALAAGCGPVFVVIGPHGEPIRQALARLPVEMVLNPDWQEGIGTSIRSGVAAALGRRVDSVMISLADQPLITPGALARLAEAHRTSGRPVVASRYAGTIGVPALFSREIVPQLLALAPGEGCKRILLEAGDDVLVLDCPEAENDVDTPADYARLTRRESAGQDAQLELRVSDASDPSLPQPGAPAPPPSAR